MPQAVVAAGLGHGIHTYIQTVASLGFKHAGTYIVTDAVDINMLLTWDMRGAHSVVHVITTVKHTGHRASAGMVFAWPRMVWWCRADGESVERRDGSIGTYICRYVVVYTCSIGNCPWASL